MEKAKENQLEKLTLEPREVILKDIEVLLYNLKRFIDTYSEIGNVSQQTIHLIRTKSLKTSSVVRSLQKLHNVKILKRFYVYTQQIFKCFSKVRDMDVMIGLLNNEKSPRSLVKDFSNKRHKYMRETFKKVSKVMEKYTETVTELLEELKNPKYTLTFRDIYKVYKIITNEYQFAKLSFMLEPSYELFNRVRAKIKNMKYTFWLIRIFFTSHSDRKLKRDLEDSTRAINDLQRSLGYFRDVMALVNILSKTSLRVSRKKDFVDAFLNTRRNTWKDTVNSFKERHIRIDLRINSIQRVLNEIYWSIHPPEAERYGRVIGYIEEFAKSYGSDVENSKKIADLAIGIYRGLDRSNLIVFDPMEEFVIKGACLTHDLGKSITPELYHKTSMEVFAKAEIHEIKTKEKLLIALVTRYHTRSIPKYSHKWYTNLKDHDKMLVNKLSGIVRLAFAISKASKFSAELVTLDSTRDCVDIVIRCKEEITQITLDETDKTLLEKMIGIPINVVVRS